MDHRTNWFRQSKWGIFTHYLHSIQNTKTLYSMGREGSSWEDCVREFDVEKYVSLIKRAGAGYVIFTPMQCFRYLCAPSERYDEITGFQPGEACSTRDLIGELADAFWRENIPFMLYFTGDGPFKDEYAGRMMGLWDRDNGQKVSDTFVDRWSSVAEELSLRYGKKVWGWWVDGCYDYIGYTDEKLGLFSKRLKAGNPDAIVTFNNGVKPEVLKYSSFEDYTAGELVDFKLLPKERFVEGSQWHVLSFLGLPEVYYEWGSPAWCAPGCKYSAEYLRDYVSKANQLGGVVSIDVCLLRDGSIDYGQIEILKSALEGLR